MSFIGRKFVDARWIRQREGLTDRRFEAEQRRIAQARLEQALNWCERCGAELDPAGYCQSEGCAGSFAVIDREASQ